MKIVTTFSCGDKAWIWNSDNVAQVTIGQVRVEFTDSPGDPESMFDNYKPQESLKESYMCVETGIGTGTVYTVGENIFESREECEIVFAKVLRKRKEDQAKFELRQRQNLLESESYYRKKLAEIEQAKKES